MEYISFKNQLKQAVEKLLKDGDQVFIHSDYRANDVVRDSINIMSEGKGYSPTLDIKAIYEFYVQNECSIDEIAENLLEFIDSTRWDKALAEKSRRIVDDIFDLEKVMDYIYICLLNRSMNRQTLKNLPSVPFLDMEATFFINIPVGEDVNAVVRVNRDMMEEWEISEDELFDIGINNMRRYSDFKIRDMDEIVDFVINSDRAACESNGEAACETGCGIGCETACEAGCRADCEAACETGCGVGSETACAAGCGDCGACEKDNMYSDDWEDTKMYPVFDRTMRNGSAVMLLPDVLRSFADTIGGDFIILPSSVNEVILMKDPGRAKYPEFKRIVCEVNKIVHKPEILSYSVYKYSRADNRVSVVA